jgi:hypothetical protein
MKKTILLAALAVALGLTVVGSTPAQAQVRLGVTIGGGPVYPYPAYVTPRVYAAPRAYVAPRYVAPRTPYVYAWAPRFPYRARYYRPYVAPYPYPVYVAPRPYYVPRAYILVRP